jgi:hypothetical protein
MEHLFAHFPAATRSAKNVPRIYGDWDDDPAKLETTIASLLR